MKKLYAVRKGRIPGIYLKWEDCERQVKQYSKAEFKTFEYHDESDYYAVRAIAQAYIDGQADNNVDSKGVIYDYDDYEKNEKVYQEDVVAFVDGSNKEGVTSYATIVYHNGILEYFEAKVIDDLGMCQAAGEYAAATAAIDYCVKEKYKSMLLVFDHREIGSFCIGEHKPRTINKYGVDLVEKYNDAIRHMEIKLIWTHSHQSKMVVDKDFFLKGNRAADELANFVRDYRELTSIQQEDYALIKLNFARIFDYMYDCPIRKKEEVYREKLPFSEDENDNYYDSNSNRKMVSKEATDAVSVIRKYVPNYGIEEKNSITLDVFLYVYMHSSALSIRKEYYSVNAIYTLFFTFMDLRYLRNVLERAIIGLPKEQLTMDEAELKKKKQDIEVIYDHISAMRDYQDLLRHFIKLILPEQDPYNKDQEGLIVYSEIMQQIWAELLQRNEDYYKNGTGKLCVVNNDFIVRFICKGGLTLKSFYQSIIANPALCKQLKEFQGAFKNPDFEGQKIWMWA